ncbi:PilZ domain-containing protein [Sulfuriflexus mobilis]|uniref:PilZ domain-containing protein n=1 Tax=Sulfuriflexus mobilis TaxID=1811807 RepID=UPI000F847984|nr:PilZ domain-containing protein [Sulfuriflexus mobilis]
MSDSLPINEHRHHLRILFEAPVTIIIRGEKFQSTAIDLSLKGALIKRPDNWSAVVGDAGILQVALSDGETVIDMEVSVAHSEGHKIGFHCDHIDIDSITHLRRLVELNLGNEELLERELSHLND